MRLISFCIGRLLRAARALPPQIEVFLRWWGTELWASLPEAWRHRLRHRRRHFLASFEEEKRQLFLIERNNDLFDRTLALTPQDAQDEASLAEIRQAIRRGCARLEVIVPEKHIVRRAMTLPLAAKDNLREALGLDLDRYTRFQVSNFYFDYVVTETDRRAETITVDTTLAPRSHVDEIVTALGVAGLPPSAVSSWRDGMKRPDATFLTMNTERSAKTHRLITIALVVLVVAFDAAAAYVPLWIKLDVLSDLQAHIELVKAEVEDAARTERMVSEIRDTSMHLVNLKIQMPSITETLGEVARVLPDSAWLEQLQVRGNRLQLAGLSRAPAELIEAIERSPILSEVRLEWPVTAAPTEGSDRFDISARIEGRSGDHQ